ncbi:MAG: MetQ/NlpA family ABC transporter substrate-binding protein [Firmicutes bacterium]|uniref:Lipoprotein n=1 Tax=Candidatus Scybalomonas excrementavium TaxID=2840943 RepID=A0A9D9I164_9FIRM|nr:MetQ/NlpA family ABC transporter substrate-binding protein [Candidatus Scybalomonas excrementavium]
MRKVWRKTISILGVAILGVSTLVGCGKQETLGVDKDGFTVVKVGVVGEYNQQWDTVNELLKEEKIKVELVKFSDYAAPNRALADGEIDLNAFQHKAFLENDVEQKGYQIEAIGDTVIAPLSIYNNKEKIQSVDDIKDGDVILIPSDLTNGGRALKLLEAAGLIECDPAKEYIPTKADITKYHVKIEVKEAESATLAKLLPDCTAALINGGNAFTAGLDPQVDSIYTEDVNPETNQAVERLVNVIVARSEEKDNEVYKKVVEAYQTDEVKKTVEEVYHGAFTCTW